MKRKRKEKIPSVVTSEEWQLYHEKKSSEKKKKADEKEARIAARILKRKEREEVAKQKKVVRQLDFNRKKKQANVDSDTGSDLDHVSLSGLRSSSGGEWFEEDSNL